MRTYIGIELETSQFLATMKMLCEQAEAALVVETLEEDGCLLTPISEFHLDISSCFVPTLTD